MKTSGSTVPACDFLVEARDLLGSLDHSIVIDARTDAAYAQGHLPGARFLTTYNCFVPDTTPAGMAAFAEDVAARYAAIGVTHDRPVVVYEADTGMRAARELWILQYLGHRHVRMLHGGLREWQAAGGTLDTRTPAPVATPASFHPAAPLAGFIALDEILREPNHPDRCLLDVRDATEYAGKDETACCTRRGHLPGAKWIEWTDLLEHGRFRSASDIQALLAARGISPEDEIVPYCHRGARSANAYYALRHAGCNRVRNFIGSFHEWSAHAGAPVEL